MYGDSTRKPSGSSTHSGSHSPTASPNSVQPPRKVTPTTTGNMLSVAMPGPNGKMGLVNSSGWLAWDSGSPSSRRNPSISSATSGNELASSQIDPTYRTNFGEGWPKSRPTSGNWDDAHNSPQSKDFKQLDSALNLQPPRQRQPQVPFSGPRVDDRSGVSKKGQLSPQRYEKDSGPSRYTSGTSPTRAFGPNSFNAHQSGSTASSGGYDPLQKPQGVEDLSVALRGMSVEDDFTVHTNRQQAPSAQNINPNSQAMRSSPSIPQVQRGPYPSFPQPDYGGYYANPPTRDTYLDYPYGFEAYHGPSDPSLFPSPALANANPAGVYSPVGPPSYGAVADISRSGMYYDYTGTRPLFYPPQPMMYGPPHSPMMSNTTPATLSEKKREMSYAVQQSLASQTLMYGNGRNGRSRSFGGAMEFSVSQPLSPMYGPNGMPIFPIVRPGRRDGGHPALSLRSPVLDEFRSNKNRKWELQDIFGYVVEFSGDQHGSRFIQQKLEVASNEEKQAIFDEIVPAFTLQLIQDVFGNYVIQKLFEYGTPVHRAILSNSMEGHILPLSLQMYGCRVVQKAIEYTGPDKQAAFVKEIESHVLKCVKDSNGNHVIQKMIEHIPSEVLAFVEAFQGHVKELSTHPYGCRVLQRCLEHLPEARARPLLDELHLHALSLMQDQFGNYVIQFVLEHGQPQDRVAVLTRLRGQMLTMARHKFASNVCEKALLCADAENRRVLIEELMTTAPDGTNPVVVMMKDQFANYVLQRVIAVVDGQQKEDLFAIIRPNLASMRKFASNYGKHLTAIEKLLGPSNDPQTSEYTNIPEVVLAHTHHSQ